MTAKEEIKQILEKEYQEVVSQITKIKKLKDIISNISNISNLILSIIITIESIVEKYNITKKEKLEIASEIIDDYIQFGFVLEFFDRKIIHILISYGVNFLNNIFGHEWDISSLKNKILKHRSIIY